MFADLTAQEVETMRGFFDIERTAGFMLSLAFAFVALGLGTAVLSERYNQKEICTLSDSDLEIVTFAGLNDAFGHRIVGGRGLGLGAGPDLGRWGDGDRDGTPAPDHQQFGDRAAFIGAQRVLDVVERRRPGQIERDPHRGRPARNQATKRLSALHEPAQLQRLPEVADGRLGPPPADQGIGVYRRDARPPGIARRARRGSRLGSRPAGS